jgi:pimeloyl-ACP methyl ester carboxylesterase
MKATVKTFFLIPGFKTQINAAEYKWLISYLQDKGIRVIKVPVNWYRTNLSVNAAEFVEFYNTHKTSDNFVLGFSFGAVLALRTANIIKPKKIFLCSLSPVFCEDLDSKDNSLTKYLGKKRSTDLATISAEKLATELTIPSVIMYGDKEAEKHPLLRKRCEQTSILAKNSTLVIVKGAPHQINFPTYREAIKKSINL